MTTDPRLESRALRSCFEDWAFRDYIGRYISQMQAAHFSASYVYRAVFAVGAFVRWLIDEHGDGSDIREDTIASFLVRRGVQSRYVNGTRAACGGCLRSSSTPARSHRSRRRQIHAIA